MKNQKRKIYKIPTVTKKEKKKRKILDFLLFLFPFFLVFLLAKVFIIGIVPSGSMFPLMNTDSAIIASRFSYRTSEPQRGDVIVFKKGDSVMTKRIIGIPGDNISIQNGFVYVNQQPIIENYVTDDITTEPLLGINYYEIPENSYFVLGDNRTNSNDSRNWEKPFVPEDDILAKVLCVFSINPLSHGFYYRGISTIQIEETYSNAPKYDASNIVMETSSAPKKEENDTIADSNTPVSSTLPVATIAPEEIIETESTAMVEETLESEETQSPLEEETLEMSSEETAENSTTESNQ